MKRVIENIVFYLFFVFRPAALVSLVRKSIDDSRAFIEASQMLAEVNDSAKQLNEMLSKANSDSHNKRHIQGT